MRATSDSDSAVAVSASVLPKLPVTMDTRGECELPRSSAATSWPSLNAADCPPRALRNKTGLKYSTFAGWVQRHRRTKRPGRKTRLRLLEAVVASGPSALGLVVQLPGGAHLELREANQISLVAALLRALEKPC